MFFGGSWELFLFGGGGGQASTPQGELATTSLDFEYLHRKSRCEILIGEDDISNNVVTLGTCLAMLFTFAMTGGNLTAQSMGELEVEFKFQRRS